MGEIRDKETAVIAIEAALTGHLVLATLHTNNAAATPMRLVEMGIEPFLVTSALSGVLAQRLARRLCVHCQEPYEPTEADIVAAGWTPEEVEEVGGTPKVFRAVGARPVPTPATGAARPCRAACRDRRDRAPDHRRRIGGRHPQARGTQGMVTLRQSGLRKALEGETTLEEVLRVVA